MKYPDIGIQMKYPNKLINADTPYTRQLRAIKREKKLSEILMSVDPSISATKLKKISLFLLDFA